MAVLASDIMAPVTLFDGLGALPFFNPGSEPAPPTTVQAFRAAVESADALIFASPEHAHGVTGIIKNALHWLVSFGPFASKSVAVFNASPRAHHADEALRETLRMMAAVIIDPASITIPLLGSKLDEDAMVSAMPVAACIRDALAALAEGIAAGKGTENASFPVR